jgi:hypothetical protein
MFAGTTIPLLEACIRDASTITSRAIMITGIKIGINPCAQKHINTELIRTLSAIGSHNFPKLLIQLFLRARYPSNVSLKQAITKKIAARR